METLQRTANRGSISTGYNVDNSAVWESDDSMRMYRTLGTPTNIDKATFSFWFKRSELGRQFFFSTRQSTSSPYSTFRIYITNDDELSIQNYTTSYNARIETNAIYRDTNAWYHIVASIDTTLSTSGDRFRLYINGVEDDSFSVQDQPLQNSDLFLESGRILEVGRFVADNGGSSYECEGYMAEAHFIDGQQLAPTEFGEFDEDSGIWKPKEYTGTYGNNGHYLEFKNSSSMGTDSSGNGNNFTIDSTATGPKQSTDTCTNNFCTMNILLNGAATKCSFTDGATFVTGASASTNWESRFGSFAVESGKWYMELKADGSKDTNNIFVGFCGAEWHGYHSGNHLVFGGQEGALAIYGFNGDIYGGTGVHGFRIYDEDIVAMMLDADNGAMYFKRLAGPNNAQVSEGTVTWSTDGTNTADPTSGASKTGAQLVDWVGATIPAFSLSKNVGGIETNFGGYNIISNTQSYSDSNGYGSFVMQPPTGYYALCTKNLAEYG
tara:strand:+ start:1541 stop:3022 length:1482 start_codon:yes stop_codon:yes gene_type:complete